MAHDFDLLKQWADLDDQQIVRIVSAEAITLLQRVVDQLHDETSAHSRIVSRENFVSTVREMRELYREGSWLLGESIIQAGEFADRQEYERATEVYERFLDRCQSKFYRDIAIGQLRKLQSARSSRGSAPTEDC